MAAKGRLSAGLLILTFALGLLAVPEVQAAEPTTAVRVVKYAEDQQTVLAEKQVDYQWMEANLPVHGDGKIHYYHQGPVFEGDKWDPTRAKNLKDKGAVKGTDIKDLCELVGGIDPGDEVVISATDGYYVKFGYQNVYIPPDRQGPIVLCWYNGEEVQAGERQGKGYVPDYFVGMRLVFMPQVPNAKGEYVFGNMDMKECFDEQYWYYYESQYPSTNGLTAKWANQVAVYSGGAPKQPVVLASETTGETAASAPRPPDPIPWLLAVAGLAVIGLAVYLLKKGSA